MPDPKPAPDPAGDLDVREQLIRGALALVTDEGPVDLSVRRLAKAADRTTMCVYTKFTNRQGLLEAVYRRASDELLAHLEPHVGAGAIATADAYVARARLDPGRYALLLGGPLATLGVPDGARHELVADLCALLARALQADGLPAPAASAAAPSLWATVHGLVALGDAQPDGRAPTPREHLARLAGIAAHHHPAPGGR